MKNFLSLVLLLLSFNLAAQDEDISKIIDILKVGWDAKAEHLDTYDDLKNLCKNEDFQAEVIAVLDEIHHYDSTLYKIAMSKYFSNFDLQVKAAMDDIQTLERDFTTKDA